MPVPPATDPAGGAPGGPPATGAAPPPGTAPGATAVPPAPGAAPAGAPAAAGAGPVPATGGALPPGVELAVVDGSAPQATAAGTAAAPDGSAPAPVPVAGAVTAGAAPATAPVGGPANPGPSAPVAGQVATHVAVLRHGPDGTHTMTVVLTPEHLGPVEVRVTLTDGVVDLAMRSATEAGRQALQDALPELRRDLQTAGLTCSGASVDRDAGGGWGAAGQHAPGQQAPDQQAPGHQGGGRHRPDAGEPPWSAGPRPQPLPRGAAGPAATRLDVLA
ncbi:flagellar hook-length control protein FliK [Geodermatophilus marinus]|nr:flagellar hook-length control protein FliK [Geodermatophilus sp. LHW52908]